MNRAPSGAARFPAPYGNGANPLYYSDSFSRM